MLLQPSKIRIELEGEVLDAYKAITYEFEFCGKAARNPDRRMKLTNNAFRCIYEGVHRAIKNEVRYPNKTGKEYNALKRLIKILEKEYYDQRGTYC